MTRSAATGINHDSLPAYLGKSLVFAAFVYLSAHFGGLFRFNDASVSLLGLTSGCALAGLLLLGANYWPALLLASVVGALSFGMTLSSAILLGLGTTTGSLSAIAFWRYLKAGPVALDSLRDLFYFTVFGAIGNSILFACFATAASLEAGKLAGYSLYDTWLLWWFAGVNGVLLLVPPVLSMGHRRVAAELQQRWPELLVLLIVTTGVSLAIFGNPSFTTGKQNLALQLAIFPLIVWGSVRFAYIGTSGVALLVSIVAMTALLFGSVPGRPLLFETALFLLAFTSVMVFAGLALCKVDPEIETAV